MTAGKSPLSSAQFSTVILAAGIGKRMRSRKIKVLHEILGKPILRFIVDTANNAGSREIVLVVGKQSADVKRVFKRSVVYARQPVPLGTGDAARCGIQKAKYDKILVLNGDIPLLKYETIQKLTQIYTRKKADCAFLSCHMKHPSGYGRVIRNKKKKVTGIKEHCDANTREKKVHEINAGVYYGKKKMFLKALQQIQTNNAQKELYLTDVVHLLLQQKKRVVAMKIKDEQQVQGINTKAQLAGVRSIVKARWFNELMENGVAIEDPATTNIDLSVKIGKFVRIRPHTLIEGNTRIRERSIIGPFSWIKNGRKRPFLKNA